MHVLYAGLRMDGVYNLMKLTSTQQSGFNYVVCSTVGESLNGPELSHLLTFCSFFSFFCSNTNDTDTYLNIKIFPVYTTV